MAVEQMVANRVVGTIPAGSVDPAAARSAMTPVGSNVTDDVLIARNRAMALVAVPLWGLSSSNCCMARMPNGVAALPRPSALADMLRIIEPMDGWWAGTSGNRRTMSGRRTLAMMRSRPPSSATFIKPKNRAITPTKPMARVTAPPAASIMALPSSAMGASPTPSQTTWRTAPMTKAMATMARKMTFIAAPPRRHPSVCRAPGQRPSPGPCAEPRGAECTGPRK